MRAGAWIAVAAASVALLTGCQSVLSTNITVDGTALDTARVSVDFQGEAGEAISTSQELVDQLAQTITSLTGQRPSIDIEQQRVTAYVDIPGREIANTAALTGVSDIDTRMLGATPEVEVTLTEPTRLLRAVEQAAGERTDAEAFLAAALPNTYVQVQLNFQGHNIGKVSNTSGWVITNQEDSLTLTQPLTGPFAGSVTAQQGEPLATSYPAALWLVVAGAGAGLVIAAVTISRRKSPKG